MNRRTSSRAWGSLAGLFALLPLLINAQILAAQSPRVSGVVSTSGTSVANASVTFIDAADSTVRFDTLTDEFGGYLLSLSTGVESDAASPAAFRLEQNYPNPFSSSTAISWFLERPDEALLIIYDLVGREVRRFTHGPQPSGVHRLLWDGRDERGEQLPRGVYFCRLQSSNRIMTRKMLYLPGQNLENNSGLAIPLHPARTAAGPGLENVRLSDSWIVRITNTANTIPRIVPAEFSGITVEGITVRNFYVDRHQPALTAVVQFDQPRQIIRGFGAANIVGWRPDMTAGQIATAFGTGDGQLGFSILRLRVPPDSTAFKAQVATARAAHQRGAILIASPWTPPARMKTNNSLIGGRLRLDCYDDFARHLASFVNYMAAQGAPLYAISVQNEPDVNVTYESCDYNGEEMRKFMRENAPAITTRVMAPEGCNFNRSLSDPILNDPVATANLGMICGHLYGGGLEPYPLAREKGVEVWMTEHLVLDTDWASALATGKEIHDCMAAEMNAYVWWYIIRYYGPIDENGTVTRRGWVMSHFSRFIRPGCRRIEVTENPQPGVHLSAYTEGTNLVIVALNTGARAAEQPFALSGSSVTALTPFVTTAEKNCIAGEAISVSDGRFTLTLEPSSITTVVSR